MADTQTETDAMEQKAQADEQARIQEELDLTKAGLSKDEAQQVTVHVAEHLEAGTLTDAEIFQAKTDAQAAEDALEHAHEMRHEQAQAVESGDYHKGEDLANIAQYDLKVADEHGAEAAHPAIDAQLDKQYDEVQALDHARFEQETAAAYSADAASHAASGDYAHADQSAAVAESHAETAVAHADAGDAGGSYATASTHDTSAEATTE